VLLRGLTRDRRHWGDFPDRLRAALPAGARVVAPDLAGNGARWRERSPATVEAMVEDLRAQVQALGLRPPLRLLAMSLGAMVAIEWARRYPAELAGVLLINTSVRPLSPLQHRLRPGAWPTVLGALARRGDGAGLQRRVLALTSRRWQPDEPAGAQLLAQWVDWQRACPVQPANALRQLWAAARYRAPARRPALPICLLNGAGDRLVHPACSEALACAWDLPLQRHPTAGHDLPLDEPDWVVAQALASQDGEAAECST
jgi:pimeloyl-ACP methyl ester carboxylesterase